MTHRILFVAALAMVSVLNKPAQSAPVYVAPGDVSTFGGTPANTLQHGKTEALSGTTTGVVAGCSVRRCW